MRLDYLSVFLGKTFELESQIFSVDFSIACRVFVALWLF